jgi:3-phenylpropionate/trans-cinnamate dioxygenase ferredoxin reductase subunit
MSHRRRPAPFVIVGGGVAGSAAAIELRDAGYRGPVVIVSEEPVLPYRRAPLATAYLRGEIDREALLSRPASWYRDAGVDLLLGATATRVDAARHLVEVRGHGPLAYERLVLATGTQVQLPRMPGTCRVRSLADADAIRGMARPGRRAVIFGTGRPSRDIASSLAALGMTVTNLDDTPVLAVVPADAGHLVHTPEATHEADVVVDARGSRPRTDLAETAGLDVDDGVIVDAWGRTADERIGAAGAVARRVDPLLGSLPGAEDERSAARFGAAVARSLVGLPASPETVVRLAS